VIPTDRPRFNLCGACVRARGLQHAGAFARVAEDMTITGPCDDCAAVANLEAWRRLDIPPPAPTLPTRLDD